MIDKLSKEQVERGLSGLPRIRKVRTTHTFVELEVSREAYLEIYTLLAEAGYHHAFLDCDSKIDMHGIALTMKESSSEVTESNLQARTHTSDLLKR